MLPLPNYVYISSYKYRNIIAPYIITFIISMTISFLSGLYLQDHNNNMINAIYAISIIQFNFSFIMMFYLAIDNSCNACGIKINAFKSTNEDYL